MGRTIRLSVTLAVAWACLGQTATVHAGPIVLSTGPYTVNLPSGGQYEVSGQVEQGGAGYIYSYTVKNLTSVTRHFELGIAESTDLYGIYSESNPTVSNGLGELLRDKGPHFTYGPGKHNYVFSHLDNRHRIGIKLLQGEVVTLSFEDAHKPTMSDWTLRERSPFVQHKHNTQLGLGRLPAPIGAPEPGTLTLAALGISGLGLGFIRRRRATRSHPE